MTVTVLNLDSAAAWDNVCPVLLPLGSPTITSIVSASMGLFVPFFVFAYALFTHLYAIWTKENNGSSAPDMDAYYGGNRHVSRQFGGARPGVARPYTAVQQSRFFKQ